MWKFRRSEGSRSEKCFVVYFRLGSVGTESLFKVVDFPVERPGGRRDVVLPQGTVEAPLPLEVGNHGSVC